MALGGFGASQAQKLKFTGYFSSSPKT
uniref:Uncharacterized protein n=1 Tax=Anguilla anguilla TaxID=7936 RepID=A0A0E9P822_ANGAN